MTFFFQHYLLCDQVAGLGIQGAELPGDRKKQYMMSALQAMNVR